MSKLFKILVTLSISLVLGLQYITSIGCKYMEISRAVAITADEDIDDDSGVDDNSGTGEDMDNDESSSDSSGGYIDIPGPSIEEIRSTNNFLSRSTSVYNNINGKTVLVDSFFRVSNEVLNNPNVAQAIMIKQCTDYKKAHPEKDVTITLTTFRMSVVASACIDPTKPDYGKMKSLFDCEYNDEGYVRISYLLLEAARYGINVLFVGQLDASPIKYNGVTTNDYSHEHYFNSHMQDDTYVEGKKIADFMTAKTVDWTCYGDKAAADMMHLKVCSVTNYIDKNGVEQGPAVWVGSTNVDAITDKGYNGHNSTQTAIVITNHDRIRQVVYNFTKMMLDYVLQEEVIYFRDKAKTMNTEQITLINSGHEDMIPEDERIVYLGTPNDKVFEFYFTPLGGAVENWEPEFNPYSKYISKLLPSVSGGDYIEFAWNNVKFVNNFPFAKTIEEIIQYSFENNPNLNNKLFVDLPEIDKSIFNNLVVGENIGVLSINRYSHLHKHDKDFMLSYVEDGVRYYVTVVNSLNYHVGAMSYQNNTMVVIKETSATGNNFYTEFGKLSVPDFDFEAGRVQPNS